MHSHHSHSSDYVAHGVDPLESIISRVLELNFHTYCLTEHMPRLTVEYLYPEELNSECKSDDLKVLQDKFSKFLEHAKIIKNRETGKRTQFLIGTEVEGCDEKHVAYAHELMKNHSDVLQFFVGSVHHVNGIAIDFNAQYWLEALKVSGNNLKQLLLDYFELQYRMLVSLEPLVVGHFDLIRLFCPQDMLVNVNTGKVVQSLQDGSVKMVKDISLIEQWPEVTESVIRNLKFINNYGGVIEINSAALRKGLPYPYPHRDIGMLVKEYCGGRFVLGDDAHGVSQVGVCYDEVLKYIDEVLQLDKLYYLAEEGGSIKPKTISLEDVKKDPFWSSYS